MHLALKHLRIWACSESSWAYTLGMASVSFTLHQETALIAWAIWLPSVVAHLFLSVFPGPFNHLSGFLKLFLISFWNIAHIFQLRNIFFHTVHSGHSFPFPNSSRIPPHPPNSCPFFPSLFRKQAGKHKHKFCLSSSLVHAEVGLLFLFTILHRNLFKSELLWLNTWRKQPEVGSIYFGSQFWETSVWSDGVDLDHGSRSTRQSSFLAVD